MNLLLTMSSIIIIVNIIIITIIINRSVESHQTPYLVHDFQIFEATRSPLHSLLSHPPLETKSCHVLIQPS